MAKPLTAAQLEQAKAQLLESGQVSLPKASRRPYQTRLTEQIIARIDAAYGRTAGASRGASAAKGAFVEALLSEALDARGEP